MPSALDVFIRFFLLGLASFGGPAAHIGYFRRAFVEREGWLDDEHFARLIALTQFLPGPGSSQLGFAIGLNRAGIPGAIAAFLGFTIPSFVLMLALAMSSSAIGDSDWAGGIVHGLKLLAVVVVADACLGMYQSFCKDTRAAAIAFGAAIALVTIGGIGLQLLALAMAAVVGAFMLPRSASVGGDSELRQPSWVPLGLFAALLAMVAFTSGGGLAEVAGDFYLAGSIVFGGGHVVLPVLEDLVAADMTRDTFLTGYAAAQAVPGPMFTLATFLGAALASDSPIAGAAVATVAIFLPGFLLVLAFHDSWHRLAERPRVAGAAAGVNAAVVGLLLAALYDPVIVSGITSDVDVGLAIAGFFALRILRLNIALLVVAFALAGLGLSFVPV